ncbi:MAG TPA: tetratricopeptide repeat protein [Alphaproteobacteria bacterium]|nr:tetratricopeptide repeat protein [Alphaproteobacteria bacterium]
MDRYFAMVYLTEANEHRDAWQELQRALKSFRGDGLPQDETLARETFDRIHRQGRAFSAFCLAFMHENGLAVGKDTDLAERHYKQAVKIFSEESDRGVPASISNLGFMYAQGKGVPKDPAKAAAAFRRAADAGFAVAKVNLGLCCLNGWGVEKDEVAAFMLFKEAADLGNGAGAACVGQMLRDGIAVGLDPVQAVKYLRDAAEEGDAIAWYELGLGYDLGLGIEVDKDEAIKWYTLSAADGNADAQARLGAILTAPGRSEVEFKKGVTLLDFATDQGSDIGDYHRGVLQLYGAKWFQANPTSARLIALSLCDRNSVYGYRLLGRMYDHGAEVGRDPKQAAEWFLKAALAGDPEAQAEMGLRYERADGVVRDLVEAYAWASLAAPVRSTGAARRVEHLGPQLTPGEHAKAEALAAARRVAPRLARDLQLDEK